MRRRKRRLLLLPVLFFLFTCSIPLLLHAEVESSIVATFSLDKSPIDVATTMDGRWAYILTPGEVQVYSLSTKSLSGRIPVDKEIGRISVSSKGDQLFLINEKTKTLAVVNVDFIQKIDVQGSPFKGPVDAPVVITVFSDYQ